eukprot:TRINITY_DN5260_c0_g1_i1.p1 TRINITY_DN5260_c0_g1~~TRINITY_DN5260_c0_g1_i1.p1  ORF type:complete len:594 (+),score=102.27 TRINITY_DN5260_c0_g1_i1:252-1784(+)
MREIELLKGLQHKNIVAYKGVQHSPNHLNIILEFVESGSMAHILGNYGIFPESLAGIYIAQVLKGLYYLHSKSIVHRDIKGANILITSSGVVKLADFGIATVCMVDPSTARLSGMMSLAQGCAVVQGSAFWMAPEIIENKGISIACDIWSLGCTIIEMATGFPPYHDKPAMAAIFRMAKDEHPPFPEEISDDLESFLSHCFKRDPQKRPASEELLKHAWLKGKYKLSRDFANEKEAIKRYSNALREKAGIDKEDDPETALSGNDDVDSNDAESNEESLSPVPTRKLSSETARAPHPKTPSKIQSTYVQKLKEEFVQDEAANSTEDEAENQKLIELLGLGGKPHRSPSPLPSHSAQKRQGHKKQKELERERRQTRRARREEMKRAAAQVEEAKAAKAANTDSTASASDKKDESAPATTQRRRAGSLRRQGIKVVPAATSTDHRTSRRALQFSDFRRKFESLSKQTADYLVFVLGTETRRNDHFEYTVYNLKVIHGVKLWSCLLYTSDAADE